MFYTRGKSGVEMKTQVLELSAAIGNLIHATQRERGASSLYLASSEERFEVELHDLQEQSDRVADHFITVCGDPSMAPLTNSEEYRRAIQGLARLASIRSAVGRGELVANDAIEYFTDLNEAMLLFAGTLIEFVPETSSRAEMLGLLALMRAKELAGTERAVLSMVFAQDRFGSGQQLWATALIIAQETLLRMAVAGNDDIFAADLARMSTNQLAKSTYSMESAALTNGIEGFDIDPELWFAQITERIDQMKELEDGLFHRLSQIEGQRIDDRSDDQAVQMSEAISGAIVAMSQLRNHVDQLRAGEMSLRHFLRRHGKAFLDAEQQLATALQTDRLVAQASRDELTGVLDRSSVPALVRAAMSRCNRTTETVAALMIDIDNFKVINDSLGHSVGDQLLQAIAGRLRRAIGSEDVLTRVGGDEFVVIAGPIGGESEAQQLAERLVTFARTPYEIDQRELSVQISIGISLISPGQGVDGLLRDADLALFQAKRAGRNRSVLFDDALRRQMEERHEMEVGIRTALAAGNICANFQPIVDVATGRIVAAEALARWDIKDGSSVTAGQFCPVAEDAGLLPQVDDAVVRSALRGRPSINGQKLKVSINVGDLQLRQPLFAEQLREEIVIAGAAPHEVWVEVTEHVELSGEIALANLQRLREMGCVIALDDFGSGYSALSVLRSLPLDVVKLDGEFVSGIDRDERNRGMFESVIQIVHSLGLKVVAENVETRQELEALAAAGCDMAQGFYIAKPAATPEMWSLPIMPGQHLDDLAA